MPVPRVLLVDDNDAYLENLEAILSPESEVVGARSAREALALLQRERFDLVVSDVRMPGMSGVELCGALRAVAPQTRVVLLTACTHEVPFGVAPVLDKGTPAEQLVAELHRYLAA